MATVSSEWINVLNTGIGLTGFSLFLLFSYLTKHASKEHKNYLVPTFAIAALISLTGGLLVSVQPGSESGSGVEVKISQVAIGCQNINLVDDEGIR